MNLIALDLLSNSTQATHKKYLFDTCMVSFFCGFTVLPVNNFTSGSNSLLPATLCSNINKYVRHTSHGLCISLAGVHRRVSGGRLLSISCTQLIDGHLIGWRWDCGSPDLRASQLTGLTTTLGHGRQIVPQHDAESPAERLVHPGAQHAIR